MDKKESPYLLDKAKFKSRRGLNELDQILVPFVQNEFNSLEEKEKFLLVELLEFEDIDLADLILYRKIEPEIKFDVSGRVVIPDILMNFANLTNKAVFMLSLIHI